MKGDFVGVGISYHTIKDSVAVISTIKGGPSEKAGIKAGDRIVYADDTPLLGKEFIDDSLRIILSGQINTAVQLRVKRQGVDELLDIKVKRGTVPIVSVEASYMLTSAENVVDEFLEEDKLILFTKNKTGKISKTFARGDGVFEDGELFIIINENSASASEIVAGAIQDNDKGIIVGRRSFGKGLVQREMSLGDGSAVRLTIARYYTPTGRSIQRPYELGDKTYFEEYLRRYENGELRSADNIEVADSLKFKTPLGKVVYGGGGITPDVFVPKNTSYEVEHLNYVLRSGYMRTFAFELLEKDRAYYNALSQEDFNEEVEITDEIIEDFISFTGEMMVNRDDAMVQKVIELSTN